MMQLHLRCPVQSSRGKFHRSGPVDMPQQGGCMRKLCLVLTATLAVTGAMIGGSAHAAAVINANALRVTADDLVGMERV
jgi:hypothetical protein